MDDKMKYHIESTLTNEEGNFKRLPSEFFYDKIQLENYSFDRKGGNPIIYALYDYDLDLSSFTKTVQCKKPDLLIRMLTLKGKLPDDLFKNIELVRFTDAYLDDASIHLIIEWCKKNGYPFRPPAEYWKASKSRVLPSLQPPKKIKFKVADFIEKLNEIYDLFLIYQVMTGRSSPEDLTESVLLNAEGTPREYKRLQDMDVEECKDLFEKKYQDITFTNRISFKGGVHLEVKTNDLFDAALYQLAILLNESEREIGICPLCHQYFERKHARQKYCNPKTCYPQKAYKRKKLAERKKERLGQ